MKSMAVVSSSGGDTILHEDSLNPSVIESAVNILVARGYDPDLVFTSVKDRVELWAYPEYGGFGRTTHLSLRGRKLLVDFAPEVPEGTSYVLDSRRFGSFVMKNDLELSVTEIPDVEKPRLVRDLTGLTTENIDEKVRVLIQEIVRIDIGDPSAAVLLIKRREETVNESPFRDLQKPSSSETPSETDFAR